MSAMFRNAGFAAIAAIFILIVLAGLGAVLVTLSTTQQRSAAFDIQGAQAYLAARAGVEFGAYSTLNTGGVGGNDCTPVIGGSKTASTSFPLNGWTVNVSCTGTAHTEAQVTVPPIVVYDITATACNRAACPGVADGSTYVERQLRVTVANK